MRAVIAVCAVLVLAASLSGCIAYDVASTAVDATTTVVGTAADVAGDVVSAPFAHDDANKKSKDD